MPSEAQETFFYPFTCSSATTKPNVFVMQNKLVTLIKYYLSTEGPVG